MTANSAAEPAGGLNEQWSSQRLGWACEALHSLIDSDCTRTLRLSYIIGANATGSIPSRTGRIRIRSFRFKHRFVHRRFDGFDGLEQIGGVSFQLDKRFPGLLWFR